MVQDRKEPTISSIKPERDEIATRQNREAPSRPAAPGQSRPATSRPPPARAKSSSSGIFALLVAVIALGVGGFSVWQLQLASASRIAAEARIAELEGRLNLSNSESGQSVTAIYEKLKVADSEIRKLWGVSYDTNRKNIATNTELLAKVDKEASSAAASAKAAKQASDAQQTDLNAVKALTSEQELVLSQLSDDIATARKQLGQLVDSAKQMEAQGKNLAEIQRRIATHEEAIAAIDSFRRSANADIQALKQRLNTP